MTALMRAFEHKALNYEQIMGLIEGKSALPDELKALLKESCLRYSTTIFTSIIASTWA